VKGGVFTASKASMPSAFWHWWSGVRKAIRSVKNTTRAISKHFLSDHCQTVTWTRQIWFSW